MFHLRYTIVVVTMYLSFMCLLLLTTQVYFTIYVDSMMSLLELSVNVFSLFDYRYHNHLGILSDKDIFIHH